MKKYLSFLLIGLVIILVSCTTDETTNSSSNGTNEYDYSDYSYYQIDSFEEQLNRPESSYYIYYYSETCPACATIKDDVLSKIANLDEDYLFLFKIYGDISVEPSFNLQSVPSLVYVVDNQYFEIYVGPNEILLILDTLK